MGNDLIRDYLSELDTALAVVPGPSRARAAIVTELGDGLADAVAYHLGQGCPPAQAAGQAIEQFGPARAVAAEFVPILAAGQVRRCALVLLQTGPLVGALWLATALLATPLGLPIASSVAIAAGITVAFVLVAAIPCTVFAVTATGHSSRSRRVPPYRAADAARIAAGGAMLGDLVLVIALSTQVPAMFAGPSGAVVGTGLAGLAALASLSRLALTAWSTARLRRLRAALAEA